MSLFGRKNYTGKKGKPNFMPKQNTLYVDLHVHTSYYPGASRDLTLENLIKFAKLKGLNVIGTGDALHPAWRTELKQNLERQGDIYRQGEIYFIPTAEVKLNTYIHSVIVLPTLESFDELYNILKNYGKLDKTGVPFIFISGEKILKIVKELGGFLFPAHLFIPFQSIYAKYKNFSDYFEDEEKEIFCVEITPSVDTPMAEEVKDISNKSFLANSDCHSPLHLGRSFTLIYAEPSFKSILKAIKENLLVSYEIPAPLGRYYETRCKNCGTFYRFNDAKTLNLKCEACGGKIWIGTKDRIGFELEKVQRDPLKKGHKFISHVPLDLILRDLMGIRDFGEETLAIIQRYKEIDLLHSLDLEKTAIPNKLKWAIEVIREGKYFIYPGGAWKEGKIILEKPKIEFYTPKQKSLFF